MDIAIFCVGAVVGVIATILIDKKIGGGNVERDIKDDIAKFVGALKSEEVAVQARLAVHLKAILAKIHL